MKNPFHEKNFAQPVHLSIKIYIPWEAAYFAECSFISIPVNWSTLRAIIILVCGGGCVCVYSQLWLSPKIPGEKNKLS